MPKGSLSIEIHCGNCGHVGFDIADEKSDDPLAVCSKCSEKIGPVSAIHAMIRGEAHTPVNVHIEIVGE